MMVVDKDVEEWTLGEVKTEWVRTLTVPLFRWETHRRGYVCKIGQLPLHWEDRDWCRSAEASPTPPSWLSSTLMTALPPLHLAVPSLSLQTTFSPENEDLPQCVHLLAQQTWNYSSSRINTCSQFAWFGSFIQEG